MFLFAVRLSHRCIMQSYVLSSRRAGPIAVFVVPSIRRKKTKNVLQHCPYHYTRTKGTRSVSSECVFLGVGPPCLKNKKDKGHSQRLQQTTSRTFRGTYDWLRPKHIKTSCIQYLRWAMRIYEGP